MKITDFDNLTKRTSDNALYGMINGKEICILTSDAQYSLYYELYNTLRQTPYASRDKQYVYLQRHPKFQELFAVCVDEAKAEASTPAPEPTAKEKLMRGIQNLMNFFTEFSFTPSFRFTNTFAFMACNSAKAAKEYVDNYFALMDSSYVTEVTQKTTSAEFKAIVKDIAQYGKPTNVINTRLKIYFGPAGTGKTTIAQEESDNRCIVCNSSMLPADLMEDFIFKDGNPDFNPSLLWDCMEQGKTIVLDEINLLPFDSLRFLQGIVDGKSEFYYKNRPVHIHDGFQIIGTMNLSLGGMTYGLPEPLVDRCSVAKEYKLTAEQLAKAIVGWDAE